MTDFGPVVRLLAVAGRPRIGQPGRRGGEWNCLLARRHVGSRRLVTARSGRFGGSESSGTYSLDLADHPSLEGLATASVSYSEGHGAGGGNVTASPPLKTRTFGVRRTTHPIGSTIDALSLVTRAQ